MGISFAGKPTQPFSTLQDFHLYVDDSYKYIHKYIHIQYFIFVSLFPAKLQLFVGQRLYLIHLCMSTTHHIVDVSWINGLVSFVGTVVVDSKSLGNLSRVILLFQSNKSRILVR